MFCPNPGAMRWIDEIQHDDRILFKSKTFDKWKINNKTIGVKKSAGNL